MSSPRIQPGTFSDLGPINFMICRVIARGAKVDNAHIFSTLARTRGLFRGWLFYSAKLMPGGKISRKETEMIIIRVAHLRDCQYEMDHHARLGRRAGVTKELLAQIIAGPDPEAQTTPGWTPRYGSILSAVDELLSDKNLSDAAWAALGEIFDDRQRIEFLLLVAQYDGLATTINTLRVERDFS